MIEFSVYLNRLVFVMMATAYTTVFTICIRTDRPEQTVLDPDETQMNAASHQGLHCLPLIQQCLDTTMGSKLYLFKF